MPNRARSFRKLIVVAAAWAATLGVPASAGAFDGPSGFARVWGSLWYLRSTHEIDSVTLVYGGVDGSSALVFRDDVKKKSFWVFLEGGSMDVSFGQVAPPEVTTNAPGALIVSSYPSSVDDVVKDSNKRDLSYALCDIWSYTKDSDKIKHIPFFTGKGWSGGATLAEAQSICDSMGITLKIKPGTPEKGRVLVQEPLGGKLVADGVLSQVTLTLDGSEPPSSVAALSVGPVQEGKTLASAIVVVPESGENFAFAKGELTTLHTDVLPPGSTEYRSDLLFRLPAAAADKLITVKQVEGADRLRLTLWRWDGGTPTSPPWIGSATTTKTAYAPAFRFLQYDTNCYLSVEFTSRNLGNVSLRFDW